MGGVILDYQVLLLKKACEELALKVVILSARLDDMSVEVEHAKKLAGDAAWAVAKVGEASEDSVSVDFV